MPPRDAGARQSSFGDVAREVVRAQGGGRFEWDGMTLATLFQPVYCVRRGIPVGDEALLRAYGRNGQPVRARELFDSLDRAARVRLDWTCRALHLRNYAVVDPGDRNLFLNVHPAALVDDPNGGREFADLVRFYGLAPESVFLEVLETDCGGEHRLTAAITAHRKHGFSIAMDHFGQGRSNFDRIVAVRPKLVKIDRSLLREALGDTQARRMLPSLVDMLKDTGAEVAVKGVENARDALASIEAGAGYLQGFHLGAPTRSPGDEALTGQLIRSARRLAAA